MTNQLFPMNGICEFRLGDQRCQGGAGHTGQHWYYERGPVRFFEDVGPREAAAMKDLSVESGPHKWTPVDKHPSVCKHCYWQKMYHPTGRWTRARPVGHLTDEEKDRDRPWHYRLRRGLSVLISRRLLRL